MPRKRDVLETLKRDELQAAADFLDLPVQDRRIRSELIDALAASRRAGLAAILEGLSRNRLKEICRALGLIARCPVLARLLVGGTSAGGE